MSDLVKRVARRLCEQDGRDPDHLEPGDDPYMNNTQCIDGYNRKNEPCHFFWRHYDEDARAAIAEVLDAQKEPSAGMEQAARELWWLDWDGDEEVKLTVTEQQAKQIWQAMLAQFKAENGL